MSLEYYIKEIKTNKNKPRIFLDGQQAARAGFSPGDKYEVEIEGTQLTLIAHKDGSRTVTGRLNKKTGDKNIPVIDLNSHLVLGIFDGMTAVRMIVRHRSIVFLPLASEMAKKERLDRLANKVANGEAIKVGDLTHGVGVLSHAIHTGLIKAGVKPEISFINEIRETLLTHSRYHNPVWHKDTIGIAAPMQELIQDEWMMSNLMKSEILSMSLPCSGASKAGSTKLKLEKMEDHDHVGHLIYAALVILSKVQPSIVILENVEPYKKTASASILRKQLRDMGYNIHEAVVNGKDFGCLEPRVRWCLVATTEGLSFNFDQIEPKLDSIMKVGDILEEIDPNDKRWKSNKGLKAKELRDIAANKGFRLKIVNEESTSVPTMRKLYQKKGSCDVQVAHPTNPELARLFTGNEHLKIKGIDPILFGELSDSLKHQGAGQSVLPNVFIPIGERIGRTILSAKPYSRRTVLEASLSQLCNAIGNELCYEPVQNIVTITNAAIQQVQASLFDDVPDTKNDTSSQQTQPTIKRRRMGGGGIG